MNKSESLLPAKSQSVRIDKALASVKKFGIYNENDALIRDIIIFLAHQYQNDLFNYTVFDPSKFCKLLNWSNNNLRRIVDETKIDPQYPEINTYMGTALLELFKSHIEVPIDPHNDSWGSWGKGLRKVVIIEELSPAVGHREKKLYKIKLSDSFKNNINNFFFQINIQTYASLKLKNSNSLQELYLFCIDLKTKILNNEDVKKRMAAGDRVIDSNQKFDRLKAVAEYDYAQVSKVKKKLEEAFERLNFMDETFKTHLVFIKGRNSRYAFTPVLKFELMPISEEERRQTRIDILDNAVSDRLILYYREKFNISGDFMDEDERKFKQWFGNKKKDFSKKAEIFAEVYSSMFPHSITPDHQFAVRFAEEGIYTISY